MFWTVCVKLKLPLCEWRAAGLHAALQPAWHLAENQWVAAVWEGCQRGSFDSAQTPFGINWQSSAEGSPAFEEYVWLNCTCMWPSARPGKGFIVNMPGLSTGCRIKSVCDRPGRWSSSSSQPFVVAQPIGDTVYLSKPEGAHTSTRNILFKKTNWNGARRWAQKGHFCILNHNERLCSREENKD